VAESRERADRIRDRATRNQEAAGKVLNQVPRLEDKTPWWARLLNNGLVLGMIVAVGAGLLYLGLGPVIRNLVSALGAWIPSLIPKPTRERARKDVQALREKRADRERIAAERAGDKMYDRAFRNESKKPQPKESTP
jgi:hypothetical protein